MLDWFASAPSAALPRRAARRRAVAAPRAREDRWLNIGAFTTAELRARAAVRGRCAGDALECVGRWARKVKVAEGRPSRALGLGARLLRGARRRGRWPSATARSWPSAAPGEFFGELAALDWGAGYGHPRLATVVATEPLRLLVLAPAHLGRLMAEAPAVDEIVRRAVRERLAQATR